MALRIENLTLNYNREIKLDDINLAVNDGEIVCIVGASGSGKSSILKSITNSLSNDGEIVSGNIFVDDINILNSKTSFLGKEIGMIFQDSVNTMNPTQKIGKQFVRFIKYHSSVNNAEASQLAMDSLKLVGLDNPKAIMNSYPKNLSGGQMQRVSIAMATVFKPKLLLADEPTSSLDVRVQKKIIDLLLSLKQSSNTAILMITHDISLAAYIADHIVVLDEGKVIEMGTRDEIVTKPKHQITKRLLGID